MGGIGPDEVVDQFHRIFGYHQRYRPVHAKGIICRGSFAATPAAASLSRAGHLQGSPVEATVRFSNASGDPHAPDHHPSARGLGVKLALPDGTTTDVVTNSLPRFDITAVDESFFELARASRSGPAQLWRLPWYLVRHPRAVSTLARNLKGLRPPPSYSACAYYAIHAYRWIDASGRSRWVRYEFVPEVRERRLSWLAARRRGPDYLQEELQDRLAREPVRFIWRVQIAGAGDDVDDPTVVWPQNRPVVDVGLLEITGLDRVPESADRVLVFDPTRVIDGVELSDDPILHFRAATYRASVAKRATPGAR